MFLGNRVAVWVGRPTGDWFSLPDLHTPNCLWERCAASSGTTCSHCAPPSRCTHQSKALSLSPVKSLNIVKSPSLFYLSWCLMVQSTNRKDLAYSRSYFIALRTLLVLQVCFFLIEKKITISCLFWEAVTANTILNGRVEVWGPLLCCFCFISHLIVQHHLYLICGQMS